MRVDEKAFRFRGKSNLSGEGNRRVPHQIHSSQAPVTVLSEVDIDGHTHGEVWADAALGEFEGHRVVFPFSFFNVPGEVVVERPSSLSALFA